MRRMVWVIIAALLLISSTVHAQTSGGQFCVRAFEDTNANGKLDGGEALLTHGINVNLLIRILIAVAGTLIVIIGMSILGFIIYMLAFGRRPPPADVRRTTGTMRAVDKRDTTGKMKTVNVSDTGRTKKVE